MDSLRCLKYAIDEKETMEGIALELQKMLREYVDRAIEIRKEVST